jgi:hypothetical protein
LTLEIEEKLMLLAEGASPHVSTVTSSTSVYTRSHQFHQSSHTQFHLNIRNATASYTIANLVWFVYPLSLMRCGSALAKHALLLAQRKSQAASSGPKTALRIPQFRGRRRHLGKLHNHVSDDGDATRLFARRRLTFCPVIRSPIYRSTKPG